MEAFSSNESFRILFTDNNNWNYIVQVCNSVVDQIKNDNLPRKSQNRHEKNMTFIILTDKISKLIEEFSFMYQETAFLLDASTHAVKTDNEREFNKYLAGTLEQYYYLSRAILHNLAHRKLKSSDVFAKRLEDGGNKFSKIVPVVTAATLPVLAKIDPSFISEVSNTMGVSPSTIGFGVGTLVGTAGEFIANGIARIIVTNNDATAQKHAKNLEDAFGERNTMRGFVDREKITNVVDSIMARYRDQINELKSDIDVSVFATYIAEKIIDHIVAGLNKRQGESPYFMQRQIKKLENIVRDYRENEELNIVDRCILGLVFENNKVDISDWGKHRLNTKKEDLGEWSAPEMIKDTGVKYVNKKGNVSYYIPSFETDIQLRGREKYGFYYASSLEIKVLKEKNKFIEKNFLVDKLKKPAQPLVFSNREERLLKNSESSVPKDSESKNKKKANKKEVQH